MEAHTAGIVQSWSWEERSRASLRPEWAQVPSPKSRSLPSSVESDSVVG